jgi:hypothetical protein
LNRRKFYIVFTGVGLELVGKLEEIIGIGGKLEAERGYRR